MLTLRTLHPSRAAMLSVFAVAISLAFLTPNVVKAAIGGRLPHRMAVIRPRHPAEWSREHLMPSFKRKRRSLEPRAPSAIDPTRSARFCAVTIAVEERPPYLSL
jgi:hypothetical protein